MSEENFPLFITVSRNNNIFIVKNKVAFVCSIEDFYSFAKHDFKKNETIIKFIKEDKYLFCYDESKETTTISYLIDILNAKIIITIPNNKFKTNPSRIP